MLEYINYSSVAARKPTELCKTLKYVHLFLYRPFNSQCFWCPVLKQEILYTTLVCSILAMGVLYII